MDRKICRFAGRVIRAFLPSFKALVLLGMKLFAKAVRNVIMGPDNPSLLHIFSEGLYLDRL